jgi:phosphoglucosamine mutase
MINVRTERPLDLDLSSEIQTAVVAAESELAQTGRIVLRASGTEPVIRVMVQGEDHEKVVRIAGRLASIVEKLGA